MTNIKPLGDRILVRPHQAETKTASGLFIPDTAKEKPQRGTVVALGTRLSKDDETKKPFLSEGDVVLFGKFSGNEIRVGDEDLLIMRESDVMCIITE